MLRYLSAHPEIYADLEIRTAAAHRGRTARNHGEPGGIDVYVLLYQAGPVTDWESAKRSDTKRFGKFFHWMLDRGMYLAPSQFEAGFVSAAHSEQDIAQTREAARQFFSTAATA